MVRGTMAVAMQLLVVWAVALTALPQSTIASMMDSREPHRESLTVMDSLQEDGDAIESTSKRELQQFIIIGRRSPPPPNPPYQPFPPPSPNPPSPLPPSPNPPPSPFPPSPPPPEPPSHPSTPSGIIIFTRDPPKPPPPPRPFPPSPPSPPPPQPPAPPPSPRPPSPGPSPPPLPPSPSPPPPLPPSPPSPSPPSPPPPSPPLPPSPSPSPPPPPSPPFPPAPPNIRAGYTEYEILDQLSNVVAVHLSAVPGTDLALFMERPSGYHPDRSRSIAGVYDIPTQTWKHIDSPDGLFCCGHTMTKDGNVIIVGGHQQNAGWPSGMKSIRLLNLGTSKLDKVTEMAWQRWYPTITLLPDGKIMIMGGTQGVGAGTPNNKMYEIWDPEKPKKTTEIKVNTTYLNRVKQNYYPFNFVLPDGMMFNFCGRHGTIMDPYTGEAFTFLPRRDGFANTQFPFTGTGTMLALLPETDYEVEIVVFGGANEEATTDLSIAAGKWSHRLKVFMPTDKVKEYTFGNNGWDEEEMGGPRVMGDCVILPNGQIIIMNGAMEGLAGDAASGGDSRANFPNFYAELYDPYAPFGDRYTTLNRSQVARMYHSTAILTTNGTILISGCDRCNPWLLQSDVEFLPPPVKAEYRVEVFYPPFWYDFRNKPRIITWPDLVTYEEEFYVRYGGETRDYANVTSAVFVAPSSTTHSFNTNQRVVGLVVVENDTQRQRLTLKAPPNVNIAPPQMYMLFLLSGSTYSTAKWVNLQP